MLAKTSLVLVALCLLPRLLLAEAPTSQAPGFLPRHPRVESTLELLDLWVEEQRVHQRLPGLSVGVIHGQELIWAKGYGHSDLPSQTPATPRTLYRLGSVTKLFTATAILQLRDAGKLRLDDPVVAHLPWFRVKNPFAGEPQITLRHLLTHTSGLTREAAFPYWTTHEFPTSEQVRAALPGQSAIYPPATKYKYSNLGLALLGEVVAAVSGQPWGDYVEQHLLRPLGMESSAPHPGDEHHARMATAYMRLEGDQRKVFEYYDTGAIAPAANLVSNVEDLARFAALHLPGDFGRHVLAKSTVREMQRPHWVHDGWDGGRGLGFAITRRNGKTLVHHGGWVGGNRTHLLLDPVAGLAVIVMTNADDGSPGAFSYPIYDTLVPRLADKTAEPARQPRADPAWKAYLGTYTDPWAWEYRVMIVDGELVMYDHAYPPEEAPEDSLTRLEPAGDHTFRMADGEHVVFELDENGQVKRVRRRYEYLYPVVDR